MEKDTIKVLGVAEEDPFHYQTWSGSSSYFFTALKKANYLYDAVSAEPSEAVKLFYKFTNFHPHMSTWKFKYYLDTGFYEAMTHAALRKIDVLNPTEYNVILQIGAWFNVSRHKDKRTVSYHDGNLATRLNSPYGYPPISEKHIQSALYYEKKLYRNVDHLFTMSRWLADSFIKDFGIDSTKITPVGAGINLPYVREIIGKSYDQPRILFVGKDFERKGGKYLLEAFGMVKREIRDATLTIIGPPLEHLPEGVRCLGYVSKTSKAGLETLLDEYSKATVFVMPSLYEPFGIVFAEAMAHKLPCIGTDICAMPEIIDHGKSGFLVPSQDARALAGRLIELLKDPSACHVFGENAYSKYRRCFTWEHVTQQLVNVIGLSC
jgi:glycosyltransferase involved in cell wall biosynthesis